MQAVGIVLNRGQDQADEFERGLHDSDPGFEAWNKRADAYQVAEAYVFGGDTIVHAGP